MGTEVEYVPSRFKETISELQPIFDIGAIFTHQEPDRKRKSVTEIAERQIAYAKRNMINTCSHPCSEKSEFLGSLSSCRQTIFVQFPKDEGCK